MITCYYTKLHFAAQASRELRNSLRPCVSQPAYIRSSLQLHASHSIRSLRLSNTNLISAPFVRTSFSARSFSIAAPKIWNSHPPSLRTCTSPDIPSVVTSRPTTASRPSNPLNSSPLAPQIRFLLTIVRVYKLYLLTYLLTNLGELDFDICKLVFVWMANVSVLLW